MLDEKNIPIALIGCGNWGQNILRDLKELNCYVTVVCKSLESIARATKYKADRIVSTIESINNPAGIIVATPTSTHLDIINSVLKFDVPIFVEKPLGTDLKKAKSIASKAGEKIFIMDKWRYHPGILALAHIAKNKELGEIIGLNIKQSSWNSPHLDVDFIDTLLPHSLAITYEILGKIPEPQMSYLIKRKNKPVELHSLLGSHPWSHCNIAINSPYHFREITLECELGIATLRDSYGKEIEIYHVTDAKESRLNLSEKRIVSTEMPLLCELREFIHYLKGGVKPKSDVHLGIKIMETISKVRELATQKEGMIS